MAESKSLTLQDVWNYVQSIPGKSASFVDNTLTGDRDYQRTVDLNTANNEFNALQAEQSREWQAEQMEKDRLFNSAEAEKNRNWQTYLSNTAITRQVADLRKAGFNPLGMIGDGATVGSGATARGTVSGGATASASPVAQFNSRSNVGDTMEMLTNSALGLRNAVNNVRDRIRNLGETAAEMYSRRQLYDFASSFKVAEKKADGALLKAAKAIAKLS